MTDPTETLTEEAFAFPKYAALFNPNTNLAYVMGRVSQLHVSKIVPVRIGPGHLDWTVAYEYDVNVNVCQAILVRSAWLRPIGSMDGARPLKVQALVDGDVVLEQSIDEHLRAGYPFPVRACACNGWEKTAECKCPVLALESGASGVFPATGYRETNQAFETQRAREALQERPYGIFATHGALIQIRVVKSGHDPVDFQARCGLTAALYSTKPSDIVA